MSILQNTINWPLHNPQPGLLTPFVKNTSYCFGERTLSIGNMRCTPNSLSNQCDRVGNHDYLEAKVMIPTQQVMTPKQKVMTPKQKSLIRSKSNEFEATCHDSEAKSHDLETKVMNSKQKVMTSQFNHIK